MNLFNTSEQNKLKELLTALQGRIDSAEEKELNTQDKAEALNQVKALAEACQKPPVEQQKLAKDSLRWFKGLVAELPTATKLAIEVNKLIPEIAKNVRIVTSV